jgi:drug/metabolite transporter (DMT)-like permease
MSPIVLVCLICAIIVVAAVLGYSFHRGQDIEYSEKDPDFRLFFRIGIAFLVIGIICLVLAFTSDLAFLTTLPLFIIGVIYTALGWNKRNTWRKHD